jgi:hypothetical protein
MALLTLLLKARAHPTGGMRTARYTLLRVRARVCVAQREAISPKLNGDAEYVSGHANHSPREPTLQGISQ